MSIPEVAPGAAGERIGIFGGSFDPPHRAHLALAQAALQSLALDRVLWIPAGDAWQKTRRLTDGRHRRAMVEAMIAGEPRFVLDDRELRRSGPSYTLDTVRELQAAEPAAHWFLIIGQDQRERLHTWHGWQELLCRVTPAVAARPGATPAPDDAGRADESAADEAAAGRADKTDETVALPPIDLSSTDIRERLAAGRPIDELVPPSVASYIDRHHLYQGTHGS